MAVCRFEIFYMTKDGRPSKVKVSGFRKKPPFIHDVQFCTNCLKSTRQVPEGKYETRLIDAGRLKAEAEICRETTDAFKELIDQQPEAVTRCKDCDFRDDCTKECANTNSICFQNGWAHDEFFCADGWPKKKEEKR